jgi:polysaccharide export outer membrane protein
MQTRSMNCRLGWLATACILSVGLSSSNALAQDAKLDHKLVRYIQDAKKSGQDEAQVQQKAIKAGWPATAVSEALAYVYGKPNTLPASSAAPVSSLDGGSQAQPETSSGPAVGPDATRQAPTSVALNGSSAKSEASATPRPSSTGTKTQAGSATSGTLPPMPYEYRIGAGDVLQVSVWKEPEASALNVVVRPDGMISTPLIKEIQVAGLTPKQAEILITERLVKVIQEPDVTVVVTGMGSKKIYAIGAVKKEGPIAYTYSMTIMQAIAEAGGLTDYAKRNKIYVLRNDNGKETRFPFLYDDILKGKHMEQNIVMLPFDTLVVPH